MTQLWGALLIFVLCPILGALPLIHWFTSFLTRKNLKKLGTGNVSVSAAFYHGGKLAGILAVLSEAGKGIAAVLLARSFFPNDPVWEIVALIALVIGRYWVAKGAGTTNVTWGMVVHDPIAAGFIFLIGGISFTILRDRASGRNGILILMPLILGLRHINDPPRIISVIALSLIIFAIYNKIPDDLDLPSNEGKANSMFKFFRGDRAILSLDQPLKAKKVGQKAATLSQLKRWGYPVPSGWVLPAGDDFQPLLELASPHENNPLIVRSSAIGEDSEETSAAGQYQSISHITNPEALRDGILQCQASYNYPTAAQYRRQQKQGESEMAVLVQQQIQGVFSGVAFSRDPLQQVENAVLIEALPGEATQVVSGQRTPQQYRVIYQNSSPQIQGEGEIPEWLLQEVARLARELEGRFYDLPQDIEWTYDGQQLWILQARPITNLQPIWTRKIAAEVIPGLIRPLTWSINRPLTCGVWGKLFTIVLGDRASGLKFNETATLHYSRAYFNATLLGKIFRRMGLPAESLEFLTRGAKFTRPSLLSTLRNLPGLCRLAWRELLLKKDFAIDEESLFTPTLQELHNQSAKQLSPQELLTRIEMILNTLQAATYYNILAPLSFSLRKSVLKVSDEALDYNCLPEVASSKDLAQIAKDARNLIPLKEVESKSTPSLFATLAESPDGESIFDQFQNWLNQYGYLSETATDIAIPRWLENPRYARSLFAQFFFNQQPETPSRGINSNNNWRSRTLQRRLELKARTAEVYNQLLAHLRWSFLALEQIWLKTGLLKEQGDIFFLKLSETRKIVKDDDPQLREEISQYIENRRLYFAEDEKLPTVPYVVYGRPPERDQIITPPQLQAQQRWQGIGASPGQAIGRIQIIKDISQSNTIDEKTIVVVPYTDAGWSVILTRAGGLISEVGGRLSHGAIIARESNLPAVMDIPNATQIFQNNQLVKINGQTGVIELLEADSQ
ncbi:MAG: glycerol-3-phosphate acyltransferase [Halothece sp.]